jgi:hypothetical protein
MAGSEKMRIAVNLLKESTSGFNERVLVLSGGFNPRRVCVVERSANCLNEQWLTLCNREARAPSNKRLYFTLFGNDHNNTQVEALLG